MTTQQQTPRDILAQFGHFLDQQETARASAQALANQWQQKADAQREELEQARAELTEARRRAHYWQAEWDGLNALFAELSDRHDALSAAHQKALEQCEHYGVALTRIATEGHPIANAALGSTPHQDRIVALFRERRALQEEISTLQTIAAAAQRYNERPYGVENGALRINLDQAVQAYGEWLRQARVSSTRPSPAPAQSEETQAGEQSPRTPLEDIRDWICPRCHAPLNNVSPGISVIAGGIPVCTPCAGSDEILRARSLT